jgi:MFS superfamily sulfate permease-like transporter
MKKLGTITVIILVGIIVSLFYIINQINEERVRLLSNQRSLLTKVTYYRTQDSLSAASVERLEANKREMELYQSDLVKEIENLNIKLKRVRAASTTGTETKVEIKTVIKDSIVYVQGTMDTVPCIKFSDPYISLEGCLFNGEFSGLIVSRDTLVQVVHRVPRQWLFFKWGTKGIRQEIMSKNPHTEITYAEYIELKKR